MKRMLAMLLAVLMLFSTVPAQAFANETVPTETGMTEGIISQETADSETEATTDAPAETEAATESAETSEEVVVSETITVTDTASADSTVTSGVCGLNWGDNVVWEYNTDTATVTISGTGAMDSYLDAYGDYTTSDDVPPWSQLFKQIEYFIIKPGVTNVGSYAFQHCTNLFSITIPASATKIDRYILGGNSDYDRPNLKEIHYGGTQEEWGNLLATTNSTLNGLLFDDSINIYYNSAGPDPITWTLENGVLTIDGVGEMPNYGQNDVPWAGMYFTKVILADTLTAIGDYAFYGCENLTEITIHDGITRIGKCAFQDCGLQTVTMPDSVTTIDNYAFYSSSLTDITIPGNGTTIGSYAFGNCKYLANVTLPQGLSTLSDCVFFNCTGLKKIDIPDTVTSIGTEAFYSCTSLQSVDIPGSVTAIGTRAFEDCTSLTRVTIPDSVTTLGNYVFSGCTKLTEATLGSGLSTVGYSLFYECKNLQKVTIKKGLKNISNSMFGSCTKLSTITIPESVTAIGSNAFSGCTGLSSISIPESVKTVESYAFYNCTSLKTVFYGGSQTQWAAIEIKNKNTPLQQATIYCNDSILSLTGLTIDRKYVNFYAFLADPHIYQMNSPQTENYAELSQLMAFDSDAVADSITWSSSDETVIKVVSGGTTPLFEPVALGTAVITATNTLGETTSFPVTVLQPNVLEFTSIHATQLFYAEGGFYSEETEFSDCVEIYLRLENKKLQGCPFTPSDPTNSLVTTDPITVTAAVSGTDLSFARDTYQNTYTAVYDPIAYETSLAELLMLFPVDPEGLVPGDSYTVEITMDSDSFKTPVIEQYAFTISDAAQARISGHIDFATGNNAYLVSKGNHYGQNMAELKNDPEYLWSKWSSLDLENYYEVVIADILIEILDIQQENGFAIMPKLLKEWGGYYKTISKGIDNILKQEYGSVYNFDETKIEKIFKLNKYDTATANSKIDDAGYRLVMDYLANPNNANKIHGVFQKIDRTKQIFGMVSVVTDFRKELQAWGNTICMMNAYHLADEELKEVLVTVSGMIPANADPALLEALQDYINYDYNVQGQAAEICETFLKTATKVSFDTFKSVWGKSFGKFISSKVLGFIGDIKLIGGTTVAATTLFGAISTGVSIGLSLSDILCDTEDKAAEMGKIIAMSDYAPYFIEALEIYENRMTDQKTEASVDMFETAFRFHKAVQSYIMEHTYNLLILKGESFIQIIRGNAEYYEVASDVLAHKRNVDGMHCCEDVDMSSHSEVKTRIIVICCPVDAYVYNEAGTEVVRIRADQLEYAEDGILVYIRDREKFVVVPADQEYSVKIVATDAGTMDYLILEYDENLELERTVKQENLELVLDRVFTGTVPEDANESPEVYDLTVRELDSVLTVPMHRMYDPNSGEHFYTGAELERDFLVEAGWHYEGVGFNFPEEGEPVYRLYEPVYGEHLYTMDEAEVDKLIGWGWRNEGVAFNSAGTDEVPQYRLHNPNAQRGGYHFTGSEAEKDFLTSIGWIDEGIGWYSCVE